MDVVQAITARKSIRAFKPDPVPEPVLREILEIARQAPSWANTQPWEFAVAAGDAQRRIQQGFLDKGLEPAQSDVARPYEFPEPYASRIRALSPSNRTPSQEAMESRRTRNFKHYGAPAIIYLLIGRNFVYQEKGVNVWPLYDCGSVVQNIMLLATDRGLGTIALAQAVVYCDVVRNVLKIPEDKLIALGIAIGYPDTDSPEYANRTQREQLESITSWHGF